MMRAALTPEKKAVWTNNESCSTKNHNLSLCQKYISQIFTDNLPPHFSVISGTLNTTSKMHNVPWQV